MEKKIFDTNLNSLVGETPIEVDGVGEGVEAIPPVTPKKEETPSKEDDDDKDLIDLEEKEDKPEDEEEEEIEEEEKEDKPSDQKKQKQSSSPLTPYAKLLVKEGVLPNLDIASFDGTADSLKQAMVDEIIGAVEYYKEGLPDRIKDLINNYEDGVPLEKLLEIDRDKTEIESFSEDKIKDNVEIQKTLVKNYLKRTTKFSDKKIESTVQYYEDSGELETEALSAASDIKAIIEKEKEDSAKQAKEALENAQKQAQKDLADLNKKIETIDEIIPGIKVNAKVKGELVKSLTTPVGKDRNGNPVNRIVAARMEDPLGFEVKLHYLFEITKGFKDFSKLTEKGKKDSMKEFEDAVTKADRMSEGTAPSDTKVNKKLIDTITKTFNIG